MERVLQWLDDLEDLVFCVPVLWVRIRGWVAFVLLVSLAVLVLQIYPPVMPWLFWTALPALALVLACGRLALGQRQQRLKTRPSVPMSLL